VRARESQRASKRERERENARERERVREKASVLPPAHIRHRTAPRPRASLQGRSCVQRGRDRTISQVRPVIACIACMRPHTHTHTHTHTANNRNDRSAPHACTRCTPAPSTPRQHTRAPPRRWSITVSPTFLYSSQNLSVLGPLLCNQLQTPQSLRV
jgi:hypothetical protein